jgi:hypothetical protein
MYTSFSIYQGLAHLPFSIADFDLDSSDFKDYWIGGIHATLVIQEEKFSSLPKSFLLNDKMGSKDRICVIRENQRFRIH